LAESLDALILVTDFFKSEPLPLSLLPPDTDEKKQFLQAFVSGKAEPGKNVEALLEVAKEAREKWSSVKNWGVFGLCWGGKVRLTSPLKTCSDWD